MPAPVVVRLGHRLPLAPGGLFGHLAATAVPGVEEWRDGAYRRTLRLPGGPATVALRPAQGHVELTARLRDAADLPRAVALCRWLLDLDVDPAAVDAALAADPVLAPLVAAAPGRRVPGTVDAGELAVRAVLGQQVSTAAARTHAARLVHAHGEEVADPDGGLTHLFPAPEAMAALDPRALAMPTARRSALVGLVRALVDGAVALPELPLGAPGGPGPPGAPGELAVDGVDAARVRAQLLALPGIGPWTVETVLMRALRDGDAFLPTDLGVVVAARRLGLPTTPGALRQRSRRWSPYRAYATQHLWGLLDHPVNALPAPATRPAQAVNGVVATASQGPPR